MTIRPSSKRWTTADSAPGMAIVSPTRTSRPGIDGTTMVGGSANAGWPRAAQDEMQANSAKNRCPMWSTSDQCLKIAAGGHHCDDLCRVAALNKQTLLDLYYWMKLIREFEEHAMDDSAGCR